MEPLDAERLPTGAESRSQATDHVSSSVRRDWDTVIDPTVDACQVIYALLIELESDPPSPGATLRLAERVFQLGSMLEQIGRREAAIEAAMYDARQAIEQARQAQLMVAPTLGAVRSQP